MMYDDFMTKADRRERNRDKMRRMTLRDGEGFGYNPKRNDKRMAKVRKVRIANKYN